MSAPNTVWDNGKVIIPMCDVQHIERRSKKSYEPLPITTNSRLIDMPGIVIVMKSTRLDDRGGWDNGVWLWGNEADQFIADYCTFVNEIKEQREAAESSQPTDLKL